MNQINGHRAWFADHVDSDLVEAWGKMQQYIVDVFSVTLLCLYDMEYTTCLSKQQ